MKAVRVHGLGGPSQLFCEDAPFPKLTSGDAIVRVHATGITPTELEWNESYENLDGSPRIPGIIGHEVAGVILELTKLCRSGPTETDRVAPHSVGGSAQ